MKRILRQLPALLLLQACALPGDTRIPDDYVSVNEIETVSSFREGLYYYRLGRYNDAERAMFDALRREPASPHVKLNLVLALLETGDIPRAKEFLDEVPFTDEIKEEHIRVSIRYLVKEYRYTEAIHFIREWIEKLDTKSQQTETAEKAEANDPSLTAEEKEDRAKERDDRRRFFQSLNVELASLLFTVGREQEAACVVYNLLDTPTMVMPLFTEYLRYSLAQGRYQHVLDWIAVIGKNGTFLHDMRVLYYEAIASIGAGKIDDAESVLKTAFALEAPSPAIYQGTLFIRNFFIARDEIGTQGLDKEEVLESLPVTFGAKPLSSPESFLWPEPLLNFASSLEALSEEEADDESDAGASTAEESLSR